MDELFSPVHIQSINSRYSDRLLVHGDSPLSLGWSDKAQQYLRFARFLDVMVRHPQPYSVLDIGCGFGDFARFLEESKSPPKFYTGLDINNDLLEIARSTNFSFLSSFHCANILERQSCLDSFESSHTFVIAAGLLNYNFHDSLDKMYEFAIAMIERMLSLSTDRVIIDFIPLDRSDSYQPEPYIALYSVPQILSYLTGRGLMFTLDLSQKPNPMQEALLIIESSCFV